MDEEKKRLASTRVQPEDPAVQEVVRISGQALGSANRVMVEDLLRKPRISHRQVIGRSSLNRCSELARQHRFRNLHLYFLQPHLAACRRSLSF